MKITIKKRLMTILLGATLGVLLFPATALADVIPIDDDPVQPFVDAFAESHEDECTSVHEVLYANGADGQIDVFENPESSSALISIVNGTRVVVQTTYFDGETLWGLAAQIEVYNEDAGGRQWYDGWMKMDELNDGNGIGQDVEIINFPSTSGIIATCLVIVVVVVVVILLLVFWRKK